MNISQLGIVPPQAMAVTFTVSALHTYMIFRVSSLYTSTTPSVFPIARNRYLGSTSTMHRFVFTLAYRSISAIAAYIHQHIEIPDLLLTMLGWLVQEYLQVTQEQSVVFQYETPKSCHPHRMKSEYLVPRHVHQEQDLLPKQ